MVPLGTSIKFYGMLSKGAGLVLSLDGKVMTVLLDGTITRSSDEPIPLFYADRLDDGDHQLYGEVESGKNIMVDHFESVTPMFHPVKNNALTTSPLPGLRIRLGGGSTFSGLGQMR